MTGALIMAAEGHGPLMHARVYVFSLLGPTLEYLLQTSQPKAITRGLPMLSKRSIFGVSVCVATKSEAISYLDDIVLSRQSTRVAFLNAYGANLAHDNPDFKDCLKDFVVFNDGLGVDLASRWLYGQPFPDNLNGTDFVLEYLRNTIHQFEIYLLGARSAVVETTAGRLTQVLPAHRVVGWHDGYFPPEDHDAVFEAIAASGATLVLVGMGNPKQEQLLAELIHRLDFRLAFSVGALFDFISGRIPRAPVWVRSIRCEWLFRLSLEPRRLFRRFVIGNAIFLLRVWRLPRHIKNNSTVRVLP
jgi:exopolysaccharide biosynthesis WecB/TagA/CpsF family protein